jgi:hypothetical protein
MFGGTGGKDLQLIDTTFDVELQVAVELHN